MNIEYLNKLGFDGVYYQVKGNKHIITPIIEGNGSYGEAVHQLSPDCFESYSELGARNNVTVWSNKVWLLEQKLKELGFEIHFHYNSGFYIQVSAINSFDNRDFQYEGADMLGEYEKDFISWIKDIKRLY